MPSAPARLRVLAVDDNPDVAYVLSETLTSMGYAVQTAVDGREAVELFEVDPPDVVLLDLRMPGMDGTAVFAELQRLDARVPVILVTATWDEGVARELLRAGAFDLVHKPIDFDYLGLSVAAATGSTWPATAEPGEPRAPAKPGIQQIAYAVVALSRRVAGPDAERSQLGDLAQHALRHALISEPDLALEALLEVRRRLDEGTLAWMSPADVEALRLEMDLLDRRLLDRVPHVLDARPPLRGVRVLVVDDDPDACELMRVALELGGAQVSTAVGAEEGLTRLRAAAPDVLVSDIAMPGRDGYWLVREARAGVREEDAQIPALAVTAYAALHDRALALASGFDDHLPKPFDADELCRRVATLVTGAD